MATTATGGKWVPLPTSQGIPAPNRALALVPMRRRRQISPQEGRAIEMLGHAIEYLADEFALDCMTRQDHLGPGMHPSVVAIEILKKCNRVVYLSCPPVPTLTERLRAWLHWQRD